METIKANYTQLNGHSKEPLFHMIPICNWVCDELHILLRITDRLWELMLSDLTREQVEEAVWQTKILNEMKRLKIAFQFWHEKGSSNLSYTSLMGPDKLKVFRDLDLRAIFQSTIRATQTRDL